MFKVGMRIVYDEEKNEKNIEKHQYSLNCAADIIRPIVLFQYQRYIIIDTYFKNDENRYKAIAEYNGRIVFFVFTMAYDDMRLISFRDANYKEREIFYDQSC